VESRRSCLHIFRARFELAQNETLVLDEIGNLDALLQTKLLRALQDGFFEASAGPSGSLVATSPLAPDQSPNR
jgi:transcriptional regulator with AAA-type ATPase domain